MNAESRPAKAAPEVIAATNAIVTRPATFQPMPALTPEQNDALRADIVARGVLVAVVVDQHGRILDGHNRARIAAELGIDCPRQVRHVVDDDEAADLALTLNCARRHLTREQVRAVIAAELVRRPDDSDRAIARRVGCSPSTVGAVRGPEVSNLDTSSTRHAEAVARRDRIRAYLTVYWVNTRALVDSGLTGGVPVTDLATALTAGSLFWDEVDPAIGAAMRDNLYAPLVEELLDPATAERIHHTQSEDIDHVPWSEAHRDKLLRSLASAGAR